MITLSPTDELISLEMLPEPELRRIHANEWETPSGERIQCGEFHGCDVFELRGLYVQFSIREPDITPEETWRRYRAWREAVRREKGME